MHIHVYAHIHAQAHLSGVRLPVIVVFMTPVRERTLCTLFIMHPIQTNSAASPYNGKRVMRGLPRPEGDFCQKVISPTSLNVCLEEITFDDRESIKERTQRQLEREIDDAIYRITYKTRPVIG